jgi:hypothetical protein
MPVICQECSVERAVAKLIIDQVARKVCQQCLDRAVAKQRPRTSEKPKAASGDPQRNCQHCQTKRATKKLYLHGTTDVVKLCDQCAAAMMTAPTTTTASTATQSGVQTPAATSARSVGTLPKEMPGRGKSPSSPVAAVTVTSAKGAPVKRTTSVATTLAARILPRLSTGGRRASAGAISKPIEHSAEEIALPSLAKLEKKIASESMCEQVCVCNNGVLFCISTEHEYNIQCGSAKATAFVHFDNRKRLACRKCVERFESLQRALAAPAPRRSSHSDAPVRASSTGGLPTATPRVRASECECARNTEVQRSLINVCRRRCRAAACDGVRC